MKKLTLLFFILFLGMTAYASRPQAILGPGVGAAHFREPLHEVTDRILSKDTTYILTGWYFIDSTHSLTIPAGTLIRGDSASAGSLIIKRGAQILADGTRENPIIITSNKPAGTRRPGDWGGVVLCGNAPTMEPTNTDVEGGFGVASPNSNAPYGGPDPDDNSGILRYVRIEYAGIAYSQDNEINGLTLAGVGRGTIIDYVQVSFANDDDVEMFGGTVDVKHYVGWRMVDDDIDTDQGYSGRIQFAYEVRDKNIFDVSAPGSSEGFESDGQPPDNNTPGQFLTYPHTNARVSNITVIGPQSDTNVVVDPSKWTCVARLRRGTKFSIYNSIMVGYPQGVDVRDTLTQRCAMLDSLEISHSSLQAKVASKVVFSDQSPSTPTIGFSASTWFNDPSKKNIGGTAPRQPIDAGVPSTAFNLDATNNAIPAVGSEPDTAGTLYQGRIAGDAFFDSVSYRGAFDPHLPRNKQWDWGWTNYDPNNYDPESSNIVTLNMSNGWNMVSVPSRDSNSFSLNAVFPTASSDAYAWQGHYVSQQTLDRGQGYWLRFSGNQAVTLSGLKSIDDTIPVVARWNMIGTVAESVSVGNIVSNPPGNIVSPYYGYNGSYFSATALQPGMGYWVKATASGTLNLNGFLGHQTPKQAALPTLNLNNVNSLSISDNSGHTQTLYFTELTNAEQSLDQYELPPTPPAGSFDVRFGSQRMVEGFSAIKEGTLEFPISVQAYSYPLTIKANIKEQSKYSIQIAEIENNVPTALHTLTSGNTATVSGATTKSLLLKIGTEVSSQPKVFSLGQNYPNPFNPTTHITFQVPKESHVKVAVYNILGEEVSTLLNDVVSAGYHTVQWNAQNKTGIQVSSGIYFVRMTSEKFSSMIKVLLMK